MDWERKDTIGDLANCGDSSLPRALLLGDSISLGYTPFVQKKLEGRVFVTRPQCNCGPSEFYLRERGNIGEWLGSTQWDVVHVNFGIWDHHFINEKEDIFFYRTQQAQLDSRPMEERIGIVESMGYHLRTTAQEYERNTRTILSDIRSHARKVVFALSTPVPLYRETLYTTDCIAEYNDIAVKVCREMDIPINDLYSVAAPLRADQNDGCHFSEYGYDILANAVVKAILDCLNL
ncbi:MAG: SGNH/GDSL hydrolase family protein [Victivallales bacterium]|nr:SGNH/GDSL hydrolase family protein [Victivallales bacterium]